MVDFKKMLEEEEGGIDFNKLGPTPPTDPMERMIYDALKERKIEFRCDNDADLDFYLPDFDIFIEVKQFHTPRISDQMQRVNNIIVAQGRIAVQALADFIRADGLHGHNAEPDALVDPDDIPPWEDLPDQSPLDKFSPPESDDRPTWIKNRDQVEEEDELDDEDIAADEPMKVSAQAKRLDVNARSIGLADFSDDQKNAYDKIMRWESDRSADPFFVCRGFPGTGKTTLLGAVVDDLKNPVPTAPTNKATKVLGSKVSVPARTIYSALGLKMSALEDKLVLDYGQARPDFSASTTLIIDETSMVGKDLTKAILEIRERCGFKVLFIGDPAQLPPVGEKKSRTWKLAEKENTAILKEVQRFDNQLLDLSIAIRKNMAAKRWRSPAVNDNDGDEGVFVDGYRDFRRRILELNRPEDWRDTKLIAWRNKTVDKYSKIIRENMGFQGEYQPTDLIMLRKPVMLDGQIIGYIDDEFTILENQTTMRRSDTAVSDGSLIECYTLQVINDEQSLTLHVPTKYGATVLKKDLNALANKAKTSRSKGEGSAWWKRFWTLYEEFAEVRYAYSLTGHRVQGTTLRNVFVDQQDIMANPTKMESLQCLMVACTRPTNAMYTF